MKHSPLAVPLIGLWLSVISPSPANGYQGAPERQQTPVQPSPSTPEAQTRGRGSEWAWWTDPAEKGLLGLTDDQANKIERLYRNYLEASRPYESEVIQQREQLNKMAQERLAADGEFAVQLSRVSALQGRLFQERSLMLYKVSKVLTAEQNAKLKEIQAIRAKKR